MVDKKLTKEEIIIAVKAKRTNIYGATDNSFISSQARGIIKRLNDFDMDDFIDWWHKNEAVGVVAGGHVLAYLEEKDAKE